MPPKRKFRKKLQIDTSDSEDDVPLKKLASRPPQKCSPSKMRDDSSSESDIENYLQPASKLDLKSSFFQPVNKANSDFNEIEEKIYGGISRLSESDSSDAEIPNQVTTTNKEKGNDITEALEPTPSQTTIKATFKQMEDYTKKIEEAKKFVERYKAKKKAEENKLDILNLLAAGEQKTGLEQSISPEDLHSSDFESCDSDQETWEEIKSADSHDLDKDLLPKKDIQITVSTMPDNVRKKKEIDLLAVMKRRLNRIRKDNQVLVHKVHVLCWIAHGNYVNGCINNTDVMGIALSLLPSEHCYPADRTDLSYLEQILNWYKKTIQLVEKPLKNEFDLSKGLELQMSRKVAYNKTMLVYIFVALLRSLGIRCRLVLSFQVEPLRPPASELHSLSAQPENDKKNKRSTSTSIKDKKKGVLPNVGSPEKNQASNSEVATQKDNKKLNFGNLKKTPPSNTKLEETQPKRNSKEHIKEKGDTKVEKKSRVKRQIKSSSEKKVDKNNIDTKTESRAQRIGKTKQKDIDNKVIPPVGTSSKKSELNKVNKKVGTKNNTSNADTVSRTKKKSKEELLSQVSTDSSHITVVSDDYMINDQPEGQRKKKKEIIKVKLPKIHKKPKPQKQKVPQLDGLNDSFSEDEIIPKVLQTDGNSDDIPNKKLNLKKLKHKTVTVCRQDKLLTSAESPRSPFTKKNEDSPTQTQTRKLNFHKLINEKSASVSNIGKPSTSKHQMDVRNDIINLVKSRMVEQKHVDRSRMVKKRKGTIYDDGDASDSDYAPEPIKKKHHDSEDEFMPKVKVKRRIPVRKTEAGLKVISSSSENDDKKKKGNDIWAEVFLEAEEKWISVDVIYGQVHCVKELHNRATHPVTYVVAWDNNNYLKDITRRYCLNFSTVTRKLRADAKWWEESIGPFKGPKTAIDREEDDDLARQQLDQPLPKSIAEYKNHPLYALKRHLLKFEGIYPPEAPTLGFVRGEAVYPRECVYTLHSRDIWLKSAKVVKPGEKPYKIVKARPKYDKLSNSMITDQLLEIFGPWQTEDYVPPTAENGVVPRNAFGNVELFKACMIPKGTVHLKLPGLNKIARRMDIDCAPAIVGFDFHGGWSHPTYDGFVVCEEFQDQLIIAWELEQEQIEKREQEKIEKRVYTNWKKLIKGLLIRERLKAKYDFGDTSSGTEKKKKATKGPRFCTKKR